MDPRAAGVNDRLGAKDQLCAPQVFTFGHVRQLDSLSEALLAPHTDACTSVNGGIHAVGLSQMTGR
jgi:hypothetical protein